MGAEGSSKRLSVAAVFIGATLPVGHSQRLEGAAVAFHPAASKRVQAAQVSLYETPTKVFRRVRTVGFTAAQKGRHDTSDPFSTSPDSLFFPVFVTTLPLPALLSPPTPSSVFFPPPTLFPD